MSQELNNLERDLKVAKDIAAKGEKLQKLLKNREFKELILEDYVKEETLRLHSLMAQFTGDQRKAVIAELDSISRFKMHINYLEQFALSAKDKAKEIEEEIVKLQNAEFGGEVEEAEFNTGYEA